MMARSPLVTQHQREHEEGRAEREQRYKTEYIIESENRRLACLRLGQQRAALGELLTRVRERARQQLRTRLDACHDLRVRACEVFSERRRMRSCCDELIASEQGGPRKAANVLRRAEQYDEGHEIRRTPL